jgi:hypothetical protein
MVMAKQVCHWWRGEKNSAEREFWEITGQKADKVDSGKSAVFVQKAHYGKSLFWRVRQLLERRGAVFF